MQGHFSLVKNFPVNIFQLIYLQTEWRDLTFHSGCHSPRSSYRGSRPSLSDILKRIGYSQKLDSDSGPTYIIGDTLTSARVAGASAGAAAGLPTLSDRLDVLTIMSSVMEILCCHS